MLEKDFCCYLLTNVIDLDVLIELELGKVLLEISKLR